MIRLRAPRRLRAVPELGAYQIHVGALTDIHVGTIIVIAKKRNTITGRLSHVPMASMTKPFLVVDLGEFRTAMHPSDVVMVVPATHKAAVVIEPREPTPSLRGTGDQPHE